MTKRTRIVNDTFEIVVDGKTRVIEIRHIEARQYDVHMDSALVGRLWGEKKAFVCSAADDQMRFRGVTRRMAATNMIYTCFKES